MHCPTCDHVSLGSCCPHCGTCEQLVGFDPTDLLNPLAFGIHTAQDYGVNPLNPIDTGIRAGQTIREPGGITGAVKGATSSIVSLATTVKWILLGGAVLGAGVVIYSAVKFIPRALDLAAANAKEAGKVGARLAERAV